MEKRQNTRWAISCLHVEVYANIGWSRYCCEYRTRASWTTPVSPRDASEFSIMGASTAMACSSDDALGWGVVWYERDGNCKGLLAFTRGNCPVPHTPSARLFLLLDLVDLGRLPLHLTGTGQRSVNLPHGLERLYVLSRRERTRDEGSTQNHPNIGVTINVKAFSIRDILEGIFIGRCRSGQIADLRHVVRPSSSNQRRLTVTLQLMVTTSSCLWFVSAPHRETCERPSTHPCGSPFVSSRSISLTNTCNRFF